MSAAIKLLEQFDRWALERAHLVQLSAEQGIQDEDWDCSDSEALALLERMAGELRQRVDRMLTVDEIAETMRVSKMTVYRLCHSGELPAVRFGRSFRVAESGLDEYCRKNETGRV